MSNPLYQELAVAPVMPNNNIATFMQKVINFKNQMGDIDPKAKIMECITSGMVDQRTLDMYQTFANQLMK